jgi:hypothetical protein
MRTIALGVGVIALNGRHWAPIFRANRMNQTSACGSQAVKTASRDERKLGTLCQPPQMGPKADS